MIISYFARVTLLFETLTTNASGNFFLTSASLAAASFFDEYTPYTLQKPFRKEQGLL
jgi:hypothetical protein